MTKQRLEELIKQGATIWSSGFDEEIELNPKNCKIEKQKWQTEPKPKLYLVVKEDEEHYPTYCLDNLREDVDRAKWERKMNTERTERFEPPMWEDLVTPYQFTIICRCKKDSRDMGTYTLYVYQSGIYIEEDIEAHAQQYLFGEDFTKENYEKACEIVRDLFKGGK